MHALLHHMGYCYNTTTNGPWALGWSPSLCQSCFVVVRRTYFYAGAVFVLIHPCQDIMTRALWLSDVVVVFGWHEGEGFILRFLWLRPDLELGLGLAPQLGLASGLWLACHLGLWFGLGLGLRLRWILRCDGMDNVFLPLVICNLGYGVVFVCLLIESLDLSML